MTVAVAVMLGAAKGLTAAGLLAEKAGYGVKEIPARWLEDPDTRVNIRKAVWEDIRGLVRLRLRRPWRAVKARP